MALIIADRVKETTTTQGVGTLTLSGATFGGFQSFSSAIGEGNTTYYCIQNESNFEIGIGTFSSGTLSRDTVIKSSSSGSKISITGVAIVFCVIPADKLLYKDESGNLTTTGDLLIDDLTVDYILANSGDFNGPVSTHSLSSTDIFADSISTNGDLGVSGLLTLRRESAGNFFHAYIDDSNDRTISLHSDGISPIWKLGLKNSPSSETVAPSYGYVSAGDSYLALVGSEDNKITLSNTAPFCVTHQGINVINAHYMTGVHLNSISSSYPALVVNGGAALSANIQEWDSYGGTTLSAVDSDGNFGIGNNNPSYQLDVTGTGSFSQAVRFGDGSIQASAALPFSSGQLIDQNKADIATVSGLLPDDSSVSGYFESRVDSADSNTTATSGYFESRSNTLNTNLNTVSGLLTPSGESFDFSTNVLTYNNSDGGSFTADLSSLSTFDTSGVNLGYSAGILTYTNNAGGTFSVDLSSISGDVYSMIVGNAPQTLDTLDEIAAALNDDENIATTLTNLISTTSGNLQSQITSNDSDIANVSGIAAKTFVVTASSSTNYTFDGMGLSSASDPTIYLHKGHTYYFDKQTSSHPLRISASDGGSVYQDADGNNVEITGQGILTFEVPQNAPDKLYYYCVSHPSSMKGLIYTTTDGSLSGYFESRSDTADSNNLATSGYFESRVDQADADISTVSGLLYSDASLSGYFESRSDDSDANNSVVSGLLYNYWTVSDGVNSENILANQQVTFSGVGGTDVSYDVSSNTVAISGGGGGGGGGGLPYASGDYYLQEINQNAADIVTVSGLIGGGGGGGTTYSAGSGLTLVGDEFNAYGGSGNFEYIELQTDNTIVPKFKFTGSGVTDTPITLEVRSSYESVSESGSALLFQGSQGQLFSITDNLSSGVIFSVADVAGLPMLEVDASGHVHIGEYADDITAYKPILLSGGVPTSTTNKLYNDAGTLYFNGSALGAGGGGGLPYASGDYYLQEIRINSASGVSISGTLQPQITQNSSDIVVVSGLIGGGGGGGGAVSAVANGADNRVVTFSSADALNGEANLTFDGSTLAVNGAFTATTKSFLIDHPTKEGMKLQYASLEGPENGVYIRGTSGSNIITLPEYWSTLVDQSTVTVSLTPIGYYQALYVEEKGKNYIKVGGAKGSYDYVVYGERKDVEKLKVEW